MSTVVSTPPIAPSPNRGAAYCRHDPSRIVGTMTADDYITFDRAAKERHEFIHGRVVQVSGGSPEHNMICFDTGRVIANQLQTAGGTCDALGSDQKVYINEDLFLYPDLTVVCGEGQFDQRDMLRNPTLIVEVLSPSTEKEDRTDKFRDYQSIDSLRHYVLIEQERVSVTHYEKIVGGLWAIVGDYTRLSDGWNLTLGETTITIPLTEIYRRVSFE